MKLDPRPLHPETTYCPCCDSTYSILISKQVFDKKYLVCSKCKLIIRNPKLSSPAILESREYYFNNKLLSGRDDKLFGYSNYIDEKSNKFEDYDRILSVITKITPDSTNCDIKNFLDYGCGLGYFMEHMGHRGYNSFGVEKNRFAQSFLKEHFPEENVFCQNSFPNTKHLFELVSLVDVIEHLSSPHSVLNDLNKIMHDNGTLVVITTNTKSIVSRFMGKKLEDVNRYTEHIHLFSSSNLKLLLEKSGFEVLHTQSWGHVFNFSNLAARISRMIPIASPLFKLLFKLMPSLKQRSCYFNPFTKLLVVAQKTDKS